jgi:hypothetical protein
MILGDGHPVLQEHGACDYCCRKLIANLQSDSYASECPAWRVKWVYVKCNSVLFRACGGAEG